MGVFKNRIFLLIEKALAKCTDRIVCISESERISALKNNVTEDCNLNVILNGIDINAVEKAMPFERKALDIPDNACIIGMVGRISPQKAPDTFMRAAKLIKEEIPNAWFMIVGDGELKKDIEQYARENSINLYITGWTDTPYSYLKMFDYAMLLSRWEGFGLAIAEYMAAEKNFIATRIDAIPTIVEDGVDGLLVDVDSPEDVFEKFLNLYNSPDFAKELRSKAKEKVYEKYNIQRVAEQHVEMFRNLCKK